MRAREAIRRGGCGRRVWSLSWRSSVSGLLREACGRIFELLLASVRREIEQAEGVREAFGATGEGGVGVEDVIADAEEGADGMFFAGNGAWLVDFRRAAVVVFARCHRIVERGVEVVVEVATERRYPILLPAMLGLVGEELLQWPAAHHHKMGVAFIELGKIAQRASEPGAAGATLLPVRAEHEVIDDELALASEEIEQALLALRRVELIILLDLHHRQAASSGGHAVVMLGQFLLVTEKGDARLAPFGLRDDRRMSDGLSHCKPPAVWRRRFCASEAWLSRRDRLFSGRNRSTFREARPE